jgi:hypothetical protein
MLMSAWLCNPHSSRAQIFIDSYVRPVNTYTRPSLLTVPAIAIIQFPLPVDHSDNNKLTVPLPVGNSGKNNLSTPPVDRQQQSYTVSPPCWPFRQQQSYTFPSLLTVQATTIVQFPLRLDKSGFPFPLSVTPVSRWRGSYKINDLALGYAVLWFLQTDWQTVGADPPPPPHIRVLCCVGGCRI